ncbi:unnamed protein product [Cochlearia groenlandica]
MSQQHSQSQSLAYPAAVISTGAYVAPSPPASYPTIDTAPVKTKSKGDGFFKGCFTAMLGLCVLDAASF